MAESRIFRLPIFAAPENRTETDAEPLDIHVAPFGDGKVPQLVKEDHEPDADGDQEHAAGFGNQRLDRQGGQRRKYLTSGEAGNT